MEAARRAFRISKVFCPTHEPLRGSWRPEDHGLDPERSQEVWIETDDGASLFGWYVRAKNPLASVVYCHGNTGNLTDSAFVMPHLVNAGLNVLLFDYRGFGRSDGFPTLRGVIADALAAARFHETIRPRNIPSVLFGYSLGGAIAAQVVHRHHFDGLILQSTFTSLRDVARVEFPGLPLHLLSGRVLDTRRAITDVRIPMLLIHGTDDPTCPLWMGKAIFEQCGSSMKHMHVVNGGLHKDLWLRTPDDLEWAINRFAADLPRLAKRPLEPVPLIGRLIDSTVRHVRRYMREAPKPL